jgi:hypothetical protein
MGGLVGQCDCWPKNFVELEIVDALSHETVRQTLKKRTQAVAEEQYCLPEASTGEFVYHMDDVLDVYTRAYDPRRPLVRSGARRHRRVRAKCRIRHFARYADPAVMPSWRR